MSEVYAALSEKLPYLAERANILAKNLAIADIPNAKRQDLKPFHEYLKNPKNALLTTNNPIKRDFEMLNVIHNDIEHEGVANLMRMYHKMIKTASARSV